MIKRFLAAALAFVVLPVSLLTAQDAADEGPDSLREHYRDWVVACTSEEQTRARSCEMVQELRQSESGQRVLALSVRRGEDDVATAVFVAPFGLRLPDGMEVSTEAAEIGTYQFLACLADGCLVQTVLDDEVLAALLGSEQLNVRMTALQGSAVDLQMSLAGFMRAWNRLGELR